MVRNVVGPGRAPQGAAAALRFDAPPGTSITGADFDVRMTSNPGWDAGIQDATNERWLWCGPDCLSSFERWMHEELRGLATQRLQALVRCSATRCRRDARHGFVALRNVRVYLDDPSAPRLDGVRGTLATAGGAWLRGLGDVGFDATDNSGIRLGRIELDGRIVHDDARSCDFGRAVPCSDGSIGAGFDTRTWPDGEHVLRLSAQDAGGNWASVDRVRADRQHRAGRAGAEAGGRRRLEPEPRADARSAAAGRAVGAADTCTPEGLSRRRPVRGVGARAGRRPRPASPRSTGRASTRSGSRSRTQRATSARSPRP